MATPDEDLNQLEKDIRLLKIEYEQYFGGGRARPPTDTEWRIEQIVKRYADRTAEISFGLRFRYNNLAQTYAKYREIFRKRLKQREEGTVPRHFGAAAKAIEAERARREAARAASAPACAARLVVDFSDLDGEAEKVAQLYQAFRNAKEEAGENIHGLTLDNFQGFLRKKTEQLKQQSGCQQVEYVVEVESGRARLKARVKE